MEAAEIKRIIQTNTCTLSPNTTVLSVLAGASRRYLDEKGVTTREWKRVWGFILTAAVKDVGEETLTESVERYEDLFPQKLLALYGTLPYLFEAMKIIHVYIEFPETMKKELAGVAIAALRIMENR